MTSIRIQSSSSPKTPRRKAISWSWKAGILVFIGEFILRFFIGLSEVDHFGLARGVVATAANGIIVMLAGIFTVLTLLEGRRWAAAWGLLVSLFFMALFIAGLV